VPRPTGTVPGSRRPPPGAPSRGTRRLRDLSHFEDDTPNGGGAAILTSVADELRNGPRFTPGGSAAGLGTREARIFQCPARRFWEQGGARVHRRLERDEAAPAPANIDDMNPELYDLRHGVFEAGPRMSFCADRHEEIATPSSITSLSAGQTRSG